MIYIFELQNLVKRIYSIKEFEILFNIITMKERTENISLHKNLNKSLPEIENFNAKSSQLYNSGIVYKLTNTEWLYCKQKYDENIEGVIFFKNIGYSFTINIVDLIDSLRKQIPNVSLKELKQIKHLASFGNTISRISCELKLKEETVHLVTSIYQSEIYENFKEKFINMVVDGATENEIGITLNVSKKRFKYYINSYAKEIHKKAFLNKSFELVDYYPNEKVKLKCPFKNGLINGKVCIFDINGNIFKEIDFVNGQINGLVKVYNNKKFSIRKVKPSKQDTTISIIENNNITEKELYENALKLNWEVLEFIPDIYKTEENCLIAFKQNVLALKYFPSRYRTKEICEQAVARNLLAFKDIPNKFKTKELSELFFEKYSKELKHIPSMHRNKEICNKAFNANYNNFKHIPNGYKTLEMCQKAVSHNGDLIAQVPKELINEELCLLAVKQNGLSIKYIPDDYKQPNIILEAVKQDYHAISLITIKNENDLAILIKNNKEVFKHLPPQVKNKQLSFIALHQDIENIRYIPTELIDEDMCLYFLRKIQKKKVIDKKHLIDTVKNRLKLLELGLVKEQENKNIATGLGNLNVISNIKLQKPESYDDIINNRKYKNQTDLIKIENPHDKIFNLTLIRKNFANIHPNFIKSLSMINKNSSSLKIKTEYKNIYYAWSFRKNSLEILLEFSNKDVKLTKYFDSIEKELKQKFYETLIIGQTKTKTVVYISTVKYSVDWAINTMYKFILILDSKLNLFYNSKTANTIFEEDTTKKDMQEYLVIANPEESINENNIFEEQEYVPLNIVDGQSSTVKLTRYERNPKNRAEAIKIHGTTCLACGFNFNDFYGKELAKDFIEIHHIKPLSQGEYNVNPNTDLVPLCSNCHSMIHKEKIPPRTVEEIKNRYKRF